MNEIIVKSWIELQEKIFENSWKEDIKRFRSPYAFRGISTNNGRLDNTLMYLGGNFKQMEKHLLRNFMKYAHINQVEYNSLWNWISLAKHHGLPTRVVDWSFSPFVAMHFLTSNLNHFDKEGVIWAVNYSMVHKHLPEKLKKNISSEGSDVFTMNMLHNTVETLEEFDALSDSPFLLFFEPPSLDERIVNQYALFSIMSNVEEYQHKWLEEHPELYFKLIIPAELKWEIRDKLDQLNINERVLFPGLDGLSKWLKRQYMQKKIDYDR